MKNVLVTGGAGFIGSNFIRQLLRSDSAATVINLDLLTYAGSELNLIEIEDDSRHKFVHGDICDASLVDHLLRQYAIDTIVHFAAESHVDRSIKAPAVFAKTNVSGTLTLLQSANAYWQEAGRGSQEVRFHHISTDEVYGSLEPGEPAWTEKAPYQPNSPYAATKAASDHLVRAFGHTYGLPYSITNCSNNYGPYQFPEKLIPLMIVNARRGIPLPIYGDGQNVRDWLYVEDHCEAILRVLDRSESGETYNLGGENQPTNLEVVHLLCDILDEALPASAHVPHRNLIQKVKDRPGHDRRYAMDISKVKKDLGWSAQHELAAGLKKTVEWYLENDDWVESISRRPSYQDWIETHY